MAGFIYIFSNPAYGRLIKIGKSAKDPEEDRLSELYTTSSPEPFTCEYWAFVDRYDDVERLVHLALRDHRKNPQREFFDVPIPAAIRTIKSVVSSLNRRSHDDLVPRIHFEKPLHEWREALRRAEEEEAKRLAEQRRREEEERQRLEEERRIEEQKRVERLAQEARKREEDRRREEEEIKRREEERRVEEQRKAELLAEQVRKREEEARRAEKEAAERLAEEHRRNEEERRIVEENQRRAALYAVCLSQWKANIRKFRRLIDAEIKRNNRVWLSMLKQLGLAYGDFSYSVVDKRLAEKADFERMLRAAVLPQISGFSSSFAEIFSAIDSGEDSRNVFLSAFAVALQQFAREVLAQHFFSTSFFQSVPYWAEVRSDAAFGPAVWRPNEHGHIRLGEFTHTSDPGADVVHGRKEINEFFSALRQRI